MTDPLLHMTQWPDPSVSTTDLIQREASVLQRGIDKVEGDWRAERANRDENRLREQSAQEQKFAITIAGIKDTFAAEIGISQAHISKIVRREAWMHVTD